MEFKQLIEMPRFYISYSIKFFKEFDKEEKKDLCLESEKNEDILFEFLYEEEETYSLNIRFSAPLFCGFSCSDALIYLFKDGVLTKIEYILEKYKRNTKDISLNIECYENKISKRYYMNTDIVGEASNILHKINPNIYFSIGKDGIYTISELRKSCKNFLDIDIYQYNNLEDLLVQLKLLMKQYMLNKNENYQKIIIIKYCIIFIKKLIFRNIKL